VTDQNRSSSARLSAALLTLVWPLCAVLCAPALAAGSVRAVPTQHLAYAYDAVAHSPFGMHGTSSALASATATTRAGLVTHGCDAASNSSAPFVDVRLHGSAVRTPTEESAAFAGEVSTAPSGFVAAESAGSLSDLFATGTPKAIDLSTYAESQGWKGLTDDHGATQVHG
jgi:hypothetical protein